MNIIDLSNPDSPTIVQTVPFTQGFPAAVAVCHSSQRSFLAVGFQRLGTSSRGKVRIYGALDDPSDPLVSAYDPVPSLYHHHIWQTLDYYLSYLIIITLFY